jgi:hypothetical protein
MLLARAAEVDDLPAREKIPIGNQRRGGRLPCA